MTWGNPATASFEKRHIRMVVVDHHRVKVHRALAPIVERILLDLASQGMTATTAGWEPGQDGRRVRIEVDGLTPDRAEGAMLAYGFSGTAEPYWFEWTGDEPAEQPETPRQPIPEETTPKRTKITKPVDRTPLTGTQRLGERPLGRGDEGMDVLTLQAFLGAPRTGVYDADTQRIVQQYHARRGFTADGSMPLASMQWIIPRTVERLRTGAAGLTVILLSSALIGRGILDRDATVETRYTVGLANVVRDFRVSLGLPRSEVVDSPTWDALVAQPRRA